MKKLLAALTLASLLVSGCQTFSDKASLFAGREEVLTNVMGDTWQIKAVWPWEDRPIHLREALNERAQQYCQKEDKSAQLLDAVTRKRAEGLPGSEGLLVFRCVPILANPNPTIFDEEK